MSGWGSAPFGNSPWGGGQWNSGKALKTVSIEVRGRGFSPGMVVRFIESSDTMQYVVAETVAGDLSRDLKTPAHSLKDPLVFAVKVDTIDLKTGVNYDIELEDVELGSKTKIVYNGVNKGLRIQDT